MDKSINIDFLETNIMEKHIFGWIATFFSLSYKIPQIYLLYKKKKHEGLSILSIVCQAFSYGFYIVHGIIIDDYPILIMGIISLIQSFILILLYFCYDS